MINDDSNVIADLEEKIGNNSPTPKKSDGSDSQHERQKDLLVRLALDRLTLLLDQFQEPCIATEDEPFVAKAVSSRQTRRFLTKIFWDESGKAAGTEVLRTALTTIEALAAYKGTRCEVHNRVARHNGVIYYDLGDNRHVVRVNSDGWTIDTTSPVYFKRYAHQIPQSFPEAGGRLEDILRYFNITDSQSKLLLLTYLPLCLFPDIPRMALVLHGDQGSAKSTTLKILRSLVDPSRVSLLAPPDSMRELVQLASHHYTVFFDNLSTINRWLSDSLCRLVTGDGFSKRQLYTDDEDILYAYLRAVGLCGINQVATRPDLLDRSIIITLEQIPKGRRREEEKLWHEFDKEKPKLFGALLDTVSACLRIAPGISINSSPRMADYYRHVVAAAKYFGHSMEEVESVFDFNSRQQNLEAIEASAVAQLVIEFMKEQNEIWEGTASELYESLEPLAERMKLKWGFPKAPNWLWRRIKEVRPNLMLLGIQANRGEKAIGTMVTLTKNSTENTATAATEENNTATSNETIWQQNGSNGSNGGINEETVENLSDEEQTNIFVKEVPT